VGDIEAFEMSYYSQTLLLNPESVSRVGNITWLMKVDFDMLSLRTLRLLVRA